jgi:hypothetical protein
MDHGSKIYSDRLMEALCISIQRIRIKIPYTREMIEIKKEKKNVFRNLRRQTVVEDAHKRRRVSWSPPPLHFFAYLNLTL